MTSPLTYTGITSGMKIAVRLGHKENPRGTLTPEEMSFTKLLMDLVVRDAMLSKMPGAIDPGSLISMGVFYYPETDKTELDLYWTDKQYTPTNFVITDAQRSAEVDIVVRRLLDLIRSYPDFKGSIYVGCVAPPPEASYHAMLAYETPSAIAKAMLEECR